MSYSSENSETLQSRVANLESVLPVVARQSNYFEVKDSLEKVIQYSKELFGGNVTHSDEFDYEIEGERFIRILVSASGTIDTLSAKSDQWHRFIDGLAVRDASIFRLSIDAHD